MKFISGEYDLDKESFDFFGVYRSSSKKVFLYVFLRFGFFNNGMSGFMGVLFFLFGCYSKFVNFGGEDYVLIGKIVSFVFNVEDKKF